MDGCLEYVPRLGNGNESESEERRRKYWVGIDWQPRYGMCGRKQCYLSFALAWREEDDVMKCRWNAIPLRNMVTTSRHNLERKLKAGAGFPVGER